MADSRHNTDAPDAQMSIRAGLRVKVVAMAPSSPVAGKFTGRTGTVFEENACGRGMHGGLWYVDLTPTSRARARREPIWGVALVPLAPVDEGHLDCGETPCPTSNSVDAIGSDRTKGLNVSRTTASTLLHAAQQGYGLQPNHHKVASASWLAHELGQYLWRTGRVAPREVRRMGEGRWRSNDLVFSAKCSGSVVAFERVA